VLGETKVVWEAHIINEKSGAAKANSPLPEFYGATMSVALIRKLRDNMHFGSLEALKVQMQKDLEQAKGYSD
jgi:FAD synthase